ncbi:SDR family oxidoreductase [Pedobacter miscanthi]|uniref:SDR family NAD(P)-dependent oxidoreductase n=1 Tax=Pedobacter miscanthi TaxID=2259170 RepID=A0A366KNP9_9SPHI|nr:SDR family oxidoreductase [Pedobacter miscanthi]RBQ03301.1 SDR family NAD(P)-dependent oxidoreductase [Pedobacter miscanthi]
MTHSQPTILVIGATGSVGSALAKQLGDHNIPFRAMVRNLDLAKTLKQLNGAELVVGDFKDKQSIVSALKGIEKVFLVTNSSEEAEDLQCNFVYSARKNGVKHLVKLSQFAADVNSPVRFLRYHAVVEQKIRESGLQYTFLRPNLFMQGLLGFAEPIKYQQQFFATAGNAKISLVDIRDIAAVALKVLTTAGHENHIYNITGPEAITHQEIAKILSQVMGREIRYINVSDEEMQSALLKVGFPAWQAAGLIEDYAHYARGEAAVISNAVEEVTGKAPRKFIDFVQEYKSAFE